MIKPKSLKRKLHIILFLQSDTYTAEPSDNSESKLDEQSDEQVNDQPNEQPDEQRNDQLDEQSDKREHPDETIDISNVLMEDIYFLSAKSDFYEKVTCNPIDQQYVIDENASEEL